MISIPPGNDLLMALLLAFMLAAAAWILEHSKDE